MARTRGRRRVWARVGLTLAAFVTAAIAVLLGVPASAATMHSPASHPPAHTVESSNHRTGVRVRAAHPIRHSRLSGPLHGSHPDRHAESRRAQKVAEQPVRRNARRADHVPGDADCRSRSDSRSGARHFESGKSRTIRRDEQDQDKPGSIKADRARGQDRSTDDRDTASSRLSTAGRRPVTRTVAGGPASATATVQANRSSTTAVSGLASTATRIATAPDTVEEPTAGSAARTAILAAAFTIAPGPNSAPVRPAIPTRPVPPAAQGPAAAQHAIAVAPGKPGARPPHASSTRPEARGGHLGAVQAIIPIQLPLLTARGGPPTILVGGLLSIVGLGLVVAGTRRRGASHS